MFHYQGGDYCAENIKLRDLAEIYGTPLYVYSAARIRAQYQALRAALDETGLPIGICYAVKANSNLSILNLLGELGAGADIVSGGELVRALTAGIDAQRLVFSGVGKTDGELAAALQNDIYQINLESLEELEQLARLAAGRAAPVNCALRINPDVNAETHAKITTGTAENKFGVDLALARQIFAQAAQYPHINLCGVAMHIGSQIMNLAPYKEAFSVMHDFVLECHAAGYAISRIDIGGGLGIPYHDERPLSLTEFAQLIRFYFHDLGADIIIAPGRYLVGDAGVLLSRIIQIKHGSHRRFVVLDAGMNDLMRPALYDAYHPIVPVLQNTIDDTAYPYDIVGPICETSDTFALQRLLPPHLMPGDLMAIGRAGAYGAVMSGTYNSRALIAEVMVDGNTHKLIRRAWTLEEQLRLELGI